MAKSKQKIDPPINQAPNINIVKHYTPKELCNILGVTKQLLTFLRRTGRGPKYVKVGLRNIVYSAAEVEKYLKERTRTSTSATRNYDLDT